MLKSLFKIRRDYHEAKDDAIEHSIKAFESKTNPLFVVLFFALAVYGWLFAIFSADGLERLYDRYGSYPLILFFAVSYFGFFLGSKLLFSPTEEELSDETSVFALFSACGRKSGRSLAAIGVSLLHSLIFIGYLVNKDIHFV